MLPPKRKMICVRTESPSQERNLGALQQIQSTLELSEGFAENCICVGPSEALLPRRKGMQRSVLTFIFDSSQIRKLLVSQLPFLTKQVIKQKEFRGIHFSIDVDPIEYM